MSYLYRLDGRRLEGSLQEPTCNDSVTTESDDWDSLRRQAEALAQDGYTVWLYDHSRRPGLAGTSDLHLLERMEPRGGRRRDAG